MKNRQITLLMFCLVTGVTGINAQEVVSSSGNFLENSSGSISFTIGEPVISTLIQSDRILTQGFQQGDITVFPVYSKQAITFEITAFPNPAKDYIIIKTDSFEGLQYLLYDMEGKIVKKHLLTKDYTEINIMNLSYSAYLLKILKDKKILRTFIIIKNSNS